MISLARWRVPTLRAAEQPGDVNILEFRAFLRALTEPLRVCVRERETSATVDVTVER